ncbi:MAG: Tetratricopeptide 2 repeat protein, partial [Planctomycetaceae bacterium]|nr:Tetratricopeptide 2 repeat protein [Planctomycetaceae bacterium]
MSQLSDQELIQLVQEKTPEELSETELDQLRERLRVSSELRDTLIEQLHFEAYLNEALGKFEVSVDEIVAVGGPARNRLDGYWTWAPVLLIGLLLASLLLVVAFLPEKPKDKPVVADQDAIKKAEEELAAAKKKADAEKVVESTKPEKVDPKQPVAVVATPVKPADPAVTKPMPAAVDPAQLWRKEFEAETFARSNMKVDSKNMGLGIGVIYADDAKPVFADYDIAIPQAGKYRIDLRYASKVQRPLKVIVNGQAVLVGVARSTTKDWKPQFQAWFPVGEIELLAGMNAIRFESDPPAKQKRLGQFPALDRFSLTSSFAVTVPIAPAESVAPNAPWAQLVNRDTPALPALEASYKPQGDQWGLRREKLQQWLEPVAGLPHQFHESMYGEMPLSAIDGVLKLRAPWPTDAVMRMSLYDHVGLRLHFWNGMEGVTFQFSDRPSHWWAAYGTTRQTGLPKPETRVLIGGADGRMDPILHGQIEFRHQAGTLILSRGDIRLITVPFARPPGEVYFDGRAGLSGFTMYRGSPLPDESFPTRPYAIRTEKPAQLTNQPKLGQGAILSALPEGTLELTSEKTKEGSQVAIPMESSGLQEIILQIENATPGTGVYIGAGPGQPIHRLGFCRELTTKATCLAWLRPGELTVDVNQDVNLSVVPFTAKKQWLRLVMGIGSLKCWTSADGIHWGRALDPLRGLRGGCVEFGLYAIPGEEKRSITLRRVEVRGLNALTSIVPDDLLDRTPNLPGDLDVEAWLESVIESQPPGIDSLQWRQACALKTLALGTAGELGKTLLAGLIADVIVRPV